MIKTVPLHQVTIGMYITDIPGHDELGIRQKGLIKDPRILRVMQQRGVMSVVVDLSQSTINPTLNMAAKVKAKKVTVRKKTFEELPQARKLYRQARKLQQQTMESLFKGDAINLDEVGATADEFIESVFRNPSALSCLRLIKQKDDYLLEHSIGVAILMVMFGRQLGFSGQELHHLCVGSLLHDIGKIKVPEKILNKPGKLSEPEFIIMRSHAAYSRDIMKATPGLNQISLDVAAQHHEKIDGSGYPAGLSGNQISKYGRMIAICDIYDALTADRVYRDGMTGPQAMKILRNMTPNQLDEALLHQFINCVGVYPPGSFVELSNGMIAIVIDATTTPLLPIVKVIYSTRSNTHVMNEELDLALAGTNEKIVRAVKPEEYRLDPRNYL
ncbi:HD-GYP domain-containing protein [Ferrimonas lipolytica]|uniref:HD-GYP domain-containing protein n=1 Tax=Ferrimonas lipolytica TaxID=2724191 RepID=A0A6H1UJ52_9GAMM|nr:HD-GYP domain-containing protein [Ferrimonas lipolytica]QIZ78246.1 HD-GYP domain-containing protein [Ferrimonas lipolytica]